jgi:hypothetical protein
MLLLIWVEKGEVVITVMCRSGEIVLATSISGNVVENYCFKLG